MGGCELFTVPLTTTVSDVVPPTLSLSLQLLAEALSQCHNEACREGGRLQLEVFVLGRSRLENKGASALAEVFGKLSSLLEVSMPQNGINQEGISALATAFAKNTQLKVSRPLGNWSYIELHVIIAQSCCNSLSC